MDTPDFEKRGGVVPAIAQDAETGEVLMVAYMNRASWEQSLATGTAHYFSTSRNELWRKGETSGNVQDIEEIRVDCDADAVLLKVHQRGAAACHLGFKSCFFRTADRHGWHVVAERVVDPETLYGKK